jgi:hypothetical protein
MKAADAKERTVTVKPIRKVLLVMMLALLRQIGYVNYYNMRYFIVN